MITVIDYACGNIKSILNILKRCNVDFQVSSKEKEIHSSDKLILPGVSNFSYCMKSLKDKKLDKVIKDFVNENKPFLGICSGMQVLGTFSDEGKCEGLNLIEGHIKKFSVAKCKIVPHVGWNKIEIKQNILTQNIDNLKRFYFCHSYYFEPASEKNIMLTTDYHIKFCSGIYKKNIFGIQFHPEKSLNDGIKLISNFVNIS